MSKPLMVLAATNGTQGDRATDFSFVPEDELVIVSMSQCSNHERAKACGCCRSFDGLNTHKGTTTVKVVPFDGTRFDFRKIVRESLRESGWLENGSLTEREELVNDTYKLILDIAERYPAGAILERLFTEIRPRWYPDPPKEQTSNKSLVVTIYADGDLTREADMQALAATLEEVAASIRQGNTSDPTLHCAFFIEQDEKEVAYA